jgi:hypothetical protein
MIVSMTNDHVRIRSSGNVSFVCCRRRELAGTDTIKAPMRVDFYNRGLISPITEFNPVELCGVGLAMNLENSPVFVDSMSGVLACKVDVG